MVIGLGLIAQDGTIRGTVIEDSNGEPLFGVTVQIKGTTDGAITDFDGKFEIRVPAGVYDLQASFVSFQTITVSGLLVEAGEVTLINQIRLKEDIELLDEVVITAEVIRTTEAALLTVKRKSANLVDGISAASFRKIGDSDAASASKRITGVSIEDGKYVYVRGLGDRYTKTLLNGVDIPGLDPDRNTLQMDIFPTNVLSNIIVSKTFTANLPADFTGGLINMETADFPDIKTTTVRVGFGFNPRMHFNSDYLTHDGGSTDFLGFDDGTRDLHIGDNALFGPVDLQQATASELTLIETQQAGFNKQLGVLRKSGFMNFNFGFSAGDQKNIRFGQLGYNFALTYQNSTAYFDDALYAQYIKRTQSDLALVRSQDGDFGLNNVLLGGLAGVALKREKAKYRVNFLLLQNGESKAGDFDATVTDEIGTDLIGTQNNLEYSQKRLANLLISGEYFFSDWNVSWKISPTRSAISDPDIRYTRYEVLVDANDNPVGFDIGTGNSGVPVRLWRDLDEQNLAVRLDMSRTCNLAGKDAKLMFGVGATLKQRDFIIREFNLAVNQSEFTGDYNELITEANLYPPLSGSNIYYPQYIGGNVNEYDASTNNYAFYMSNEFYPFEKLKAIIGIRGEAYEQFYTGENQQNVIFNDEKVINEFNLFPSGNFIYQISDRQNFRFAYNRTIARYSFKEASTIEYFDPLSGRTFVGGLNTVEDPDSPTGALFWDGNIRSTLIDNFDLRWEIFGSNAETFSISTFYKGFQDPIEVVQIPTAQGNFQPINVGDATVYGTEIEFRKSANFISSGLENFFFNGNATWSVSEITMTDAEFLARQRIDTARASALGMITDLNRKRDLQGQAPYIINAGLSYDGSLTNGLEVGLYYNIQGPTLTFTGGVRAAPDVYSIPFNSLNFSAIKTFGKEDKMRLTFRVNNILNDKREWEYDNEFGDDAMFEARSPGTRISAGFRYSIN